MGLLVDGAWRGASWTASMRSSPGRATSAASDSPRPMCARSRSCFGSTPWTTGTISEHYYRSYSFSVKTALSSADVRRMTGSMNGTVSAF